MKIKINFCHYNRRLFFVVIINGYEQNKRGGGNIKGNTKLYMPPLLFYSLIKFNLLIKAKS